MARLNRSVERRSWQPGQHVPGFLNQLTGLVILIPHLGQVTVIILSSIFVILLGRKKKPDNRSTLLDRSIGYMQPVVRPSAAMEYGELYKWHIIDHFKLRQVRWYRGFVSDQLRYTFPQTGCRYQLSLVQKFHNSGPAAMDREHVSFFIGLDSGTVTSAYHGLRVVFCAPI